MQLKPLLFSILMFFSICAFAVTQDDLEKPTEEEATAAVGKLMTLPSDMMEHATVKLGTCIPALNPTHKGQIACTVAFVIGSSSSETQVDFYRDSDRWIAQPSQSQDQLPFPDPKLY